MPYKVFDLACSTSLILIGIVSIAGFFGRVHMVLEAFANFRVGYVIIFAALTLAFLLLKTPKKAAAAAALLILNGTAFIQFYTKDRQSVASDAATVRVLEMNVWGGKNSDWDQSIQLIRKHHPDVIGISEITPTWMKVLREEMRDYPYQIHEPRFGGVALLSKYPLISSQVLYFGARHRPRISADIDLKGQRIQLVFVHTFIPVVHDGYRDKELAAVADEVALSKTPVVVFGDLNITPWCFNFDKLLATGKLYDTARGFGFQPTWCAWIPPMFPIDHCLVNDKLSVTNHQVLTYIGSDHLPLLVDLALNVPHN